MAKSKSKKEVVKLNTSFDELVAMSVQGNPKPKPKNKKNGKKQAH